MNYYIQGDAAKADKIKAAFEKLGYDTSFVQKLSASDNHILFTLPCDYRVHAFHMAYIEADILKRLVNIDPDYKELELPVEPKFKVEDWVVFNDSHNSIYQISEIKNSYYMLTHTHGGSMSLSFSQGEFIRPWSIEDAKDGDVLVSGIDNPFIYDGNIEFSSAGAYVGVSRNGRIRLDMFPSKAWTSIKDVKPATKEQQDLLFAKLREAGYTWDEKEKELKKIQPHYDISNFYAGMPVLVRADNNCRWDYSIFSRITGNEDWKFAVCNGVNVAQCIPFEGNEHLLGTTDMPSEEYINW